MKIDDDIKKEIGRGELAKLCMVEIEGHFRRYDELNKKRFVQLEEEASLKFREALEKSRQ